MKGKFEVGKTYKCISRSGSAPSFEEIGNTMNGVCLFSYMMEDIYIKNDDAKYKYIRDVVEVQIEGQYEVLSLKPLMLKGPLSFPALEPSNKFKNAVRMLRHLLHETDKQRSSMMQAIIDTMSWHIENQWDETLEGLKEIVGNHILDYVRPYRGSSCGFSTHDIKKRFILSIVTPADYNVAVSVPSEVLPDSLFVKWPENSIPRIMVSENMTLYRWYTELISPI